MRFSPSFLDEIRARVRVSDVVGRKVKLQRRGKEFVGLSPFNPEKTPSFTVNDQKGFYHCFSSGQHGDIFRFLTEVEGLSFPEAVERLAGEAGLELPRPDPRAAEREEKARTLHEVLEKACVWFQERLQAREGAKARGYLADRGVQPATQQFFRLGYAGPGRHELKQFLAGQKIPAEDMARAGLIIAGDDIPVSYDRFRDRIMFPITDLRGRIIGFGGRALTPDAQAKYINSPETPLFHKGSNLYNASAARKGAHEAGSVIAVEGYMDVIALAQAGIGNAVAPLGTALTEEQLGLLWRMADEPVLCFDGDAAGVKAAYRAIDVALPRLKPGKSLRFVLLPEGRDPDDLVREDGAEAFRRLQRQALPLVDMVWQRERESHALTTPERRAAFEARIGEIAREVGDETVRRHYAEALRQRLATLWSGPLGRGRSDAGRRHQAAGWRQRPGRAMPGAGGSLRRSGLLAAQGRSTPPREAVLLLAAINHPEILDGHAEELSRIELVSKEADALRAALLGAYAEEAGEPRAELEAQGHGEVIARLERAARTARIGFALAEAQPYEALRGFRHILALHRKSVTLHKELQDAERALAAEASEESLEHLKDIQAQLASVEGTEALPDGYDG